MGKYQPLTRYLEDRQAGFCLLAFSEVEGIIGASLPSTASNPKRYAQWWANDKTHTQALSWLRAGWAADGKPDLVNKQVRFVRVGDASRRTQSGVRGNSQVIVRNLDDEVVAALKQRARRNNRSLEGELRLLLTRAAKPGRAELVAEADRIRAMSGGPLEDSVSLLREDRERRWRS
ncbi:MAG: hypothetical protein F4Y45_15935 [Acidobacteria bacterium]|nr:hypothetical protein [Acidobacteriota bacterium]MYJ06203.1 hypothetical protein [Acidobacteriota bacterium]